MALASRQTFLPVKVFHKGKRVAAHLRSPARNRHTTVPEHMPSAHRRYAEWTPARITREAARIGPATAQLIETIMHAKPHPEQGFPRRPRHPAAGQELRRRPPRGRLPARPQPRRQHLWLDRLDPEERSRQGFSRRRRTTSEPIRHGNIRGRGYYH